MALVDWAIVAVMVLAVLGGLSQGFFRSVFSLGGLLLGLALAAWNYGRIAAQTAKQVIMQKLREGPASERR